VVGVCCLTGSAPVGRMSNRPTRPLGSKSIIIVRAALVLDTRDNSLYRDWVNATQTTVTGCNVQPYPMAEKLNVEDTRDREYVRTALRCYAPKTTDVVYTDRVIYNSQLYDIFGDGGEWDHVDGSQNHLAFILRRRNG
jgi:hypothetical protein